MDLANLEGRQAGVKVDARSAFGSFLAHLFSILHGANCDFGDGFIDVFQNLVFGVPSVSL